MSTPATPPPTNTPPPVVPPAPKESDSFVKDILAGINKVITQDGKIVEVEPSTETNTKVQPTVQPATISLGELIVEQERKKKELEANPPPEPTPEPAPSPTPAPTPAPVPAARLKKKPEIVAQPAPAPVVPPPPAPAPAPAPTPAPADPDATYIAGLSPEQKDELDMAAFAETKFPDLKGKRAETLAYFKKVDQFAQTNPNAPTEEFDQFLLANRPKWAPGQKRKVETAFITQEATTAARKEVLAEVAPQLETARKKVKELEVEPIVRQAVSKFDDLICSPEITPEKMEALPADVSKLIREKGYAAAAEEYPIEAPIFARTSAAGQEWLRLTNGLAQFNPNDQMHTWLFDFVAKQGAILKSGDNPNLRGKPFMPLIDHLNLSATNPQEAAKYSSFNDNDVLDMLAVNGQIAYNAELSRLEKAGFKRERKKTFPIAEKLLPTPASTPTPPAAPSTASPRARAGATPGPGVPTPKAKSEAAAFIDKLLPGSAERLNIT